MTKDSLKRLVYTALMIALGLILPTLFHVIGAGPVFLPMHIPVLLCGFLCGGVYGLGCGAILPLISAVTMGMPVLFPTGCAMVFELGAYGFFTGWFSARFSGRRGGVYFALVPSMLLGRAISGVANGILLGMAGKSYGISAFVTASFVTALPGILLQLVVIPVLVPLLRRALGFEIRQ